MSDSSLSSAEMLLCNLPDHQVIRIDGRPAWMNHVSEQVVASHPDSLVLEGDVTLNAAQTELAALLGVESDAAFIQQALKAWLDEQRRLLIIVNPDAVEENALTYLLGLPSICNEQGSAVTIILLSKDVLVDALKNNPSLASKLDGYYQEEIESGTTAAAGGSSKWLVTAAAVVCVCAGAWYLYDQAKPPVVAPTVIAEESDSSEETADSQTEVAALETETSVIQTDEANDASQSESSRAETPVVVAASEQKTEAKQPLTVVSTDSVADKKASDSRQKKEDEINKRLLADLSQTVEKARSKLKGETPVNTISSAKPVSSDEVKEVSQVSSTNDKSKALSSVESSIASNQVSVDSVKTAEVSVKPPVMAVAEVKQGVLTQEPTKLDKQRKALDQAVKTGALSSHKEAPKKAAPATATSPKSTSKYVSVALNNEAEVRKVVDAWGQAWGNQDWDAYINSYLQNTKPYGVKMSLDEWRAFRKERLLKPEWIKLTLGEPKLTRLDSHWFRAEFYQRFEKPGYADETTKRLELTLTSQGWRIASEATDGTVVLKRPGG